MTARKAEVVVRVELAIIGLNANAMFVSPARRPSIITLRTTVGITLDTTRQATPAPQENIPLPKKTVNRAMQESTKMEPALGVTLATRERLARLRRLRQVNVSPVRLESIRTMTILIAPPAPLELTVQRSRRVATPVLRERKKTVPAPTALNAGKDIIAPGVLQVAPHVVKGSTVMPSPEPKRPIAQNAPQDLKAGLGQQHVHPAAQGLKAQPELGHVPLATGER